MAPNKAARGQRRAPAAPLHALLDAAVDAIVMIDSHGEVLTFNHAAEGMFGYSQNEVLGQPVDMLMPEPYRSEHARYLQRYLETGERRVIGIGREVQGRHSSGRVFPIWLSIGEAAVDGSPRFVGIIRDLSAQRAAEEERRALEARLAHVGRFSLMGEMAAGIAHEINQPLSAIVTYSQAARRLLENPAAEKEALVKACGNISEQVHRASQVVENLRNFIRKHDVVKESLDLNAVIAGVMTLLLADTNRAGIAVATQFAQSLPRVEADAIQLQQVLLNLTRNAVDAMQTSPRKTSGIRISTFSGHQGEVSFEVRDHGTGVSSRLGQVIFDPFVTTKPEGLGVGLAISRTIVQNHGGKLTYSDNPEGGAVFTVSLPARTEGSP
jgi:two-component system, LuxR family, sensor kinase FixL